MDYFLSEEQQELQKLVRQVAQEKVKPVAANMISRVNSLGI